MKDINVIKEKIEKLLMQTVENGATEAEAHTSLLLARKLMLKYKLNDKDLINSNQTDVFQLELPFNFNKDISWPRQLLSIFVDNCGVFTYVKQFSNHMHYVLFGLEVDVECVKTLFEYAYNIIEINANKNFNDYIELFGKENSEDIKDAYIQGFLSGLEYKYEEQNKSDKKFELLLIPNKKVKEAYDNFTSNFNKVNIINNIKLVNESEMINKGFRDGKSFGTTPLNNGCLKIGEK